MAKAKKTATNQENNMTNLDPLAELGIGVDAVEPAVKEAPATPAASTTESEDVAKRQARAVVSSDDFEIEDEVIKEIPVLVRGGGATGPRGSKYGFEDIAAPTQDGYASRVIRYTGAEGEDQERFVRSVQSATTGANRQYKDEGRYFVSRTVTDKEGKFVGVRIIRTDAKQD